MPDVNEMRAKVESILLAKAKAALEGKTIQVVRYMTNREAENSGWQQRPIVIFCEDGSFIVPQSDAEGNDGGALWLYEALKNDDDPNSIVPVLPFKNQ
mgnify:FL=1